MRRNVELFCFRPLLSDWLSPGAPTRLLFINCWRWGGNKLSHLSLKRTQPSPPAITVWLMLPNTLKSSWRMLRPCWTSLQTARPQDTIGSSRLMVCVSVLHVCCCWGQVKRGLVHSKLIFSLANWHFKNFNKNIQKCPCLSLFVSRWQAWHHFFSQKSIHDQL